MIRRLVLIVLLWIVVVSAYAQTPYFQHYVLLKNKSPVVNQLYQDKTGFIWFATHDGLFKFNGASFHQFTVSDSLPDNDVTAIAEDSLGRIWTGHKNGGIAIIDHDRITKFNPAEGLPSVAISDILFDRKGNLWFSTLNEGLYFFTLNRLYLLDKKDGMPDLFVYDLSEDSEGNVWAGTDRGIAICTLNDRKAAIRTMDSRNGLPDNIVRKLVVVNDAVWIGTDNAGVVTYDLTTKKFTPAVAGSWAYGSVSDIALKENQVWIACPQTGLLILDKDRNQVKVLTEKTGAQFMSINTLLADHEGNIWTASRSAVMRTYGDYIAYLENINPAKDLSVVAVAKDQRGVLWFANSEGLFTMTQDETGGSHIVKQLEKTVYEKYSVISLYVDHAGYVWAGLYGEGVIRINPSTGKIAYLNKELRNGNVLNITGKENDVWLATLGGGTHVTISGEQLLVKNYTRKEGLTTDYIYQVFIDSENKVWFATDGKGVDMLDQSGFHHYERGLLSKVIYSITEDADHHIWVNTQSGGLYTLSNNTFKSVAIVSSEQDMEVGTLTTDRNGNLVIFHNAGIRIFDVRKNKVHDFGDAMGMKNRKPNLNAFSKDAYGEIYFGTDAGIVTYSSMGNHEAVPKPYIESFMVLDKKADLSRPLRFDYTENYITINFLGFWFQNESNLNFRYRLDNNDRDWISTKDHEITYSSLSPGKYTFHVQVSETDDFTSAEDRQLTFVINPPFWQTPLFYILCAAVFIFSGYSYIKYRERKIRLDKQILEQMVKERTIEIERKNILIQEQTEEIRAINENLEGLVRERTEELERKNKALEEYAFITAHNLRAPVASVLGLINLMSKLEHDAEAKEIINHMQVSAERLDAIVSSMTRAIEKGD